MEKKVAIIGGWSEGPKHERRVRRELKRAGLEVINSGYKADVIITHSTGCYFLSYGQKQKLAVIINPPYWPGKSIVIRTFHHAVLQAPRQIKAWGSLYWLRHRCWNIFYILTAPFRTVKIWRSLKAALLEQLKHSNVLIIRNEGDVFCSPAIKKLSKQYKNTRVVQLPGLHDDLWVNPKPYIDLIRKELSQ